MINTRFLDALTLYHRINCYKIQQRAKTSLLFLFVSFELYLDLVHLGKMNLLTLESKYKSILLPFNFPAEQTKGRNIQFCQRIHQIIALVFIPSHLACLSD